MRGDYLRLVTVLAISAIVFADEQFVEKKHKKRQIYREQVSPHAGGKIPDTAFETDRLFLNRLQTEGIAIPDGIVAQQRNPLVFPHSSKKSRAVYRVALTPDNGRYISNEGGFFFRSPPSIETTYLYPQVHSQPTEESFRYPKLKPFQLNQNKMTPLPAKQESYLYISPNVVETRIDSPYIKGHSGQVVTTSSGSNQFASEFTATHVRSKNLVE